MYPAYCSCYGMPYCPIMHNGFPVPHGSGINEEAKDYRNAEEKKPEIEKYKEREEVHKDDFVLGFVPHHNHGSVDYTSYEYGHVHQCLDVTFPPKLLEEGTHIHYTEGYVLFEYGHNHYYKAWSGPAFRLVMVYMFIIMIFIQQKIMAISIILPELICRLLET